MKVSDLVKKKNAKVSVRVPVAMQKEHGLKETVSGKIGGVRTEGRVARVAVLVRGKSFEFRPQDLSLG
jgi:hypothetical protein